MGKTQPIHLPFFSQPIHLPSYKYLKIFFMTFKSLNVIWFSKKKKRSLDVITEVFWHVDLVAALGIVFRVVTNKFKLPLVLVSFFKEKWN